MPVKSQILGTIEVVSPAGDFSALAQPVNYSAVLERTAPPPEVRAVRADVQQLEADLRALLAQLIE